MIDHFDNVLHHLLMSQVLAPGQMVPVTDDQVGFQPPNDDWRTVVAGLGTRKALNVYLLDLRENRKLRTNERDRRIENGVVLEDPAPTRVDCHYLITAWSPATEVAGRTTDEHQLLAEVLRILVQNQPLVPRRVFAPAPLPGGFPDVLADAEIPNIVVPTEGFPKYAEFWGTMGAVHPWKPGVYLVATLPVVQPAQPSGYMVTTRITEYRRAGLPETAEVWIQIGGHVLDGLHPLPNGLPSPVGRASVQLETTTGNLVQRTTTNELGEFTFERLRAARYRLRTTALGLGEKVRDVDVPTETGEYDLQFP